ncbi:MAG: hypothetical protein H8D56_12755 [Planctomycetes bacterium]|nr:hypothetical protein [Planctomycetota bacterium]MBL7143857.1 hypothetical protein [Phycisphaerae bacterium]
MKTKKAVVGTAKKNELHNTAYPESKQSSRLKVFIGELLLFGDKQRKETWWLFDSKLRKYIDLRISGGDCERQT